MTPTPSPTTIMIIDDKPENLNVLEGMLRQEGWSVRAFVRGQPALDAAAEEAPDLVLLDILMPEMDGYEVCRRFKADETLRSIPIIFLSAITEPTDKVRGFAIGGVDYVTKPFAEVELLARVHTHLQLRRHQLHLEELVRQRVSELVQAHRRLRIWDDAKNQWLHTLSREMRTPLTGVFGIAELLFMDLPADSEHHSLRQGYASSRQRIEKLMDDALTLAQIDVAADRFAVQPVPLTDVLQRALNTLACQAPEIPIHVELDAVETVTVLAESALLDRAITDLLLTATLCCRAGEAITLRARVVPGQASVSIATAGKALSAEALETFFEVGGQRLLFKEDGDFGLGAALAVRIVRLFNGRLSVRNGAEKGLVLDLMLPTHTP